jgi:hypothetical protein
MQIHININYFKNPQHHTQSYQLAKKKQQATIQPLGLETTPLPSHGPKAPTELLSKQHRPNYQPCPVPLLWLRNNQSYQSIIENHPAPKNPIVVISLSQIAQATRTTNEPNASPPLLTNQLADPSPPLAEGIRPCWNKLMPTGALEHAEPDRAAEATSNEQMIQIHHTN